MVLLSSTTQDEALLPGPIIPDGQGGILATWTISPSQSTGAAISLSGRGRERRRWAGAHAL